MASPGIPGSQTPAGLDYLVREIADLKRQLRELGPSIAASFQPVITDLQNKQAQLDSQQATLTNLVNTQIVYGSQKAYVTGSATTTTRTNMAVANIVVPDGYTKALVIATSSGAAMNTTASPDYLLVATAINTYDGGENDQPCQSGFETTVTHTAITTLSGLTSGSYVQCIVSTRTNTAAWAATSTNLWRVQGAAIFTR